jgi:hypothetical protein
MPRPVAKAKTCPYGCRFFSDGWHAENCPGSPNGVGPQAVFLSEPEYQREREADDGERVYEALDHPMSYPEKGVTE